MKRLLLLLVFAQSIYFGQAQKLKGKVVYNEINTASLQNIGGENPIRRISVYLSTDFDQSTRRYPVIYFLYGIGSNESNPSVILDKAIASGKIKPVIFVVPNEHTLYGGSFYSNSTLTAIGLTLLQKIL